MECWFRPVAVPTMTFGAVRSKLTTWASVEKYMSVAPESTIPLAFVGSARCWLAWLARALLMFGKVKVAMSRVVLT